MLPSLEGWSTKAKEAPSSYEVRLTQLDTNPVFQCMNIVRKAKATYYQHLLNDNCLNPRKF